jgi:hypothetical protein
MVVLFIFSWLSSQLSCPGFPVLLYCPSNLVLVLLYLLFSPCCDVLIALAISPVLLPCPGCPVVAVTAVLSQLSYLPVLSQLSCPVNFRPILSSSVMTILPLSLSLLSSPALRFPLSFSLCHVRTLLSRLSCPECPVPVVLG